MSDQQKTEGALWNLAEEVLCWTVESGFEGKLPTHQEILTKAYANYEEGLEIQKSHEENSCSCLKTL